MDAADVERCHDQGHAINIKLMKCGGITPALTMVKRARARGMRVMIGCMLESSLGVTAAAHISPLADWADLDGNLLLADDPFEGVRVVAGRLVLPDAPGLGVRRRGATPE
jgi:L-alanine-DL-glutamate epimerase-like enolase superfamily enzyme